MSEPEIQRSPVHNAQHTPNLRCQTAGTSDVNNNNNASYKQQVQQGFTTTTSSTTTTARAGSQQSIKAGGPRRTKFLLVVGGVCSSLGKGVTTSSIGALLRGVAGLRVSCLKIDPYINVDAGLMSPFEHGEVYVLNDGGEVDLDLGNYERWVGLKLGRDHNITTGKVYNALIQKERKGEFLGKTVQVVPHFTSFVQDHIKRVAQIPTDESGEKPDVCLIELGGTVGDIESAPFIEALRQLRFSLPPEDFSVALVTYLPNMGGQKTKPTQHAAKTLMSLGLIADFLFCRCSDPVEAAAKEKLSSLVGIKPKYIFSAHNVPNIYEVPVLFNEQHVVEAVLHKFHLAPKRYDTPAGPTPISKNMAFPSTPPAAAAGGNDNSSVSASAASGGGGSGSLPPSALSENNNLQKLSNSPTSATSSVSSKSSGGGGSPTGGVVVSSNNTSSFLPPPLDLSFPTVQQWADFAFRLSNPKKTIRIAFVGKYVGGGSDAYFSVLQTYEHCCLQLQIKIDFFMMDPTLLEEGNNTAEASQAREAVKKMDGIFVPGGFGLRAFQGKCEAAKIARENKIPFFGVCYGFQAALVDMCRSVLKLQGGCDSEETDTEKKAAHHIIRFMPDIDRVTMGATMRLGGKPAFLAEPPAEALEKEQKEKPENFISAPASSSSSSSSSDASLKEKFPSLKEASYLSKMYGGVSAVVERHRHRYEFNRKYLLALKNHSESPVRFTGASDPEYSSEVRVEAFELPKEVHPYFVATQYHPEFLSNAYDPSPPFLSFVAAAAKMEMPSQLSRPTTRKYVAAAGAVTASSSSAPPALKL